MALPPLTRTVARQTPLPPSTHWRRTVPGPPLSPRGAGWERFAPPFNRWLPENTLRTAPVPRGDQVSTLPHTRYDLPDVQFAATNGRNTSVDALVATSEVNGFLVLHYGSIVAERYMHGLHAEQPHWLASCTKGMVASVAGTLVAEGQLRLDGSMEDTLPELRGTGYAGVTLQHVLDMRSGVDSSTAQAMAAVGWQMPTDLTQPTGIHGLTTWLPRQAPLGGDYVSRSADIDVVGWACERVSGLSMPQLISLRLWQPMGAEHAAGAVCDPCGTMFYGGGISATLRDVGRFAQMVLQQGMAQLPTGRKRVLPAAWVSDTRHGNPDVRQAYQGQFFAHEVPDLMYHNHFWGLDPTRGTTLNFGAHGQMIYTDPRYQVAIVVLSTWPTPQSLWALDWLGAFDAIAATLNQVGVVQ